MTQPTAAASDLAAARQRVASLALPETTLQRVEMVPPGPFTPPGASVPIAHLPAFCRVVGVIAPQVNFEVWLPAEGWNGRFQGAGNGGLAGVIAYEALGRSLTAGYAAASTDTGHVGSTDARWAMGRPDLVADYGHRAIHEMTLKGKAITTAFYEQAPRYSYWVGCSTGGRQGLMEAQRYPEDYDGVLAGAPAINFCTFHANQVWAALSVLDDPETYITPEQYQAINRSVLDAWDEADGVRDGVIEDPGRVVVDYAAVQQAAGLTGKQVVALRRLYQGPVNAAGDSVHPGLMPGGEADWGILVAGPKPFPIGVLFYGQMVHEQPDWDWRTFDLDADVAAAAAKFQAVLDPTPDLSPFAARGGKLLLYHGWNDQHIPPGGTLRYWEQVQALLGGADAADRFARLFMAPGMGHCRGGSGPDTFDGLAALVAWVERGEAPEHIIAARLVDGAVQRTRPLCPYPRTAHYTGHGSTDDASSFVCQAPG